MASVSSLDQDMRRLRLDRYTPEASNEVRSWIESTLGETLPAGDLLDALKDGVALCKLANLVLPPPGIRYKASTMPFTQRENISQFLTACERQPLLLPAHDRFLTVDLYDTKDPAQVLQCIGAFSRAANAVKPAVVRTAIGPRRAGAVSPTRQTNSEASWSRRQRAPSISSHDNEPNSDGRRAMSPAFTGGSNTSSSTKTSNPSVTSWSTKTSEYSSAPAWNIHQYGYMGGASQGNQGISFGARRQITTPQVSIPSVVEKERRRKEQDLETERQRRQHEQLEKSRKEQREQEDRQARRQEQEQWEDETRKARENERRQLDLDRQRWEEEEMRWQEEDAKRKKEQEQADKETQGAFLSQAEQKAKDGTKATAENDRILELERQLEEAKERERRYQLEREERSRHAIRTPETPEPGDAYRRPVAVATPMKDPSRDSWAPDERLQLRQAWNEEQTSSGLPTAQGQAVSSRPLPNPDTTSSLQATPQNMRLNDPQSDPRPETQSISSLPAAATDLPVPTPLTFSRPTSASNNTRSLPNPSEAKANYSTHKSSPYNASRADRYLASNPAPNSPSPRTNFPREMGMTSESERADEDTRRQQSQQKTKAGGWASKSLLEREMERERERQKEWEEQQMAKRPASGLMGPRELRR